MTAHDSPRKGEKLVYQARGAYAKRLYTFRVSERETSILERYWHRVGGTLILEVPLVRKTSASSPRRLDGLILPDAERRVMRWSSEFKVKERKTIEDVVEGADVAAVQVKPHRLDLPLLGQTFFAVRLLERLGPASVRGVALCTQDDEALREVFEAYPNMEVEVDAPI